MSVDSATSIHYTYVGADRPLIPGALWIDGRPGPAPNTPLPGISTVSSQRWIPYEWFSNRGTYDPENEDAGWREVRSRYRKNRLNRSGRRPAASKQTLDDLLASLGGRSCLVV
jgi:hypothetical protein